MGKKRWFFPLVLILVFFSITESLPSSIDLKCEYEEMTKFLNELAANYSHISRLVSIGTTEEGREIWTVIVSDSPNERPLLRPQVKFVGNVNGMSGSACYVILRLVKDLVEQYENEASIERKLLESMEIHIIPNLNPDGYSRAVPGSCFGPKGRNNANDINLNTNFPDIFHERTTPIQKETKALTDWMDANEFTISVSVISGAKVVVYPFDTIIIEEGMEEFPTHGEQHLTPDDDIFKHLALTFAGKTGLSEAYCPQLNRQFPQGIINGAEWSPKMGTMMDYNYLHGTFEIMVGVSCCRNENNSTTLDSIWRENREGLLHTIYEAGSGIKGQVIDAETYHPIPTAHLTRKEYDYLEGEDSVYSLPWYTTSQGEFWRPWLPGFYRLRVEAVGYKTKVIDVEVHSHQPTFIRVELEKNVTEKQEMPTTLPTTSTPSTTPISSEQSDEGGLGENEVIKKMTNSHQIDGFPVGRNAIVKISDEGITTTRVSVVTVNDSVAQEKPVLRGSTATKYYLPLMQMEQSLLSVMKRVDEVTGNSGSTKRHSVYQIITMCLLFGHLHHQLAENNM